jgi:hypothetical protein
MKNILFYGNCQVGSLIPFMKHYLKEYTVTNILCWVDLIEKDYFLSKILNADIIITQPISPNYRNVDYLNTEFILNNCKKTAKVIIFPSLYFDFYYIDLIYKWYNNDILHTPSDYHYEKLVECYKNKLDQQYFIDNYVNNPDYKTKDELNNIANSSLNELSRREALMEAYNNIYPVTIIKGSDFIRENYVKQLLFYSMNHPTKYLMQYICKNILQELGKDTNFIDLNVDPLFSSERGILYKCIQKVVDFNIMDYTPQLSKFNANNINYIVKVYYDSYDQLDITKLS